MPAQRDLTQPDHLDHLHDVERRSLPNDYETCIWSIGSFFSPYDSDQLFPVLDFGGKIGDILSHCFSLTFKSSNMNVHNLQGIIDANRNYIYHGQLVGPTLFASLIQAVTTATRPSFIESLTYTIPMNLTDGIVIDLNETINVALAASSTPP